MDSVSSNQNIAVEFGHCPRTPASDRKKDGRTSAGKENANSAGSLHKRFFSTLKQRSRSFSRSSDDGSPTEKPVKRRQSIVDLFSSIGRSSQDCQRGTFSADIARTPTNTIPLATATTPSPSKRRKSLGNLLSPSHILGSITNRVSQTRKHAPHVYNDPLLEEHGADDASPVQYLPEIVVVSSPEPVRRSSPEPVQIRTEPVLTSQMEQEQLQTGPVFIRFAEGSTVGIDLFETRVNRLLDGIGSSSNQMQSQPAEPEPTQEPLADLAPVADAKKRPQTPDSYTQLLVDSVTAGDDIAQRQDDTPLYVAEAPEARKGVVPSEASVEHSKEVAPGQENSIEPAAFTFPDGSVPGKVYLTSCLKVVSDSSTHRDSRPRVTFREVSSRSSSVDLDPEFCHRQLERDERYRDLNLTVNDEWNDNRERISQAIELTVSRMTRNYYSSCDGSALCVSNEDLALSSSEAAASSVICAAPFEIDEHEAWHAVFLGSNLLGDLQPSGTLRSIPSEEFMVLLTSQDPGSFVATKSRPHPPFKFRVPVEQLLQESVLFRTPPEPFYASQASLQTDGEYLEAEQEEDLCPEYEHFVRRSYGLLERTNQKMSTRPMQKTSESDRHVSYAPVTVQFPETMNLLQHAETFPSKVEAISALYGYKLAELSNFCIYDNAKRIIYAHAIDSPVPNPADLKKKGLEVLWLPMQQDVCFEGLKNSLSSSGCLMNMDEGISFRNQESGNWQSLLQVSEEETGPGKRSDSAASSMQMGAGSSKANSLGESIIDDNFFLEDDAASLFSHGTSHINFGELRASMAGEEIIDRLDFEDNNKPVRTWFDLAKAANTKSSIVPRSGDTTISDDNQTHSSEDTLDVIEIRGCIATITSCPGATSHIAKPQIQATGNVVEGIQRKHEKYILRSPAITPLEKLECEPSLCEASSYAPLSLPSTSPRQRSIAHVTSEQDALSRTVANRLRVDTYERDTVSDTSHESSRTSSRSSGSLSAPTYKEILGIQNALLGVHATEKSMVSTNTAIYSGNSGFSWSKNDSRNFDAVPTLTPARQQTTNDRDGRTTPSDTTHPGVEHSPGFHFTAVKEHLMDTNDEPEETSILFEEQTEVLFDATEHCERNSLIEQLHKTEKNKDVADPLSNVFLELNKVQLLPEQTRIPQQNGYSSFFKFCTQPGNTIGLEKSEVAECLSHDNSHHIRRADEEKLSGGTLSGDMSFQKTASSLLQTKEFDSVMSYSAPSPEHVEADRPIVDVEHTEPIAEFDHHELGTNSNQLMPMRTRKLRKGRSDFLIFSDLETLTIDENSKGLGSIGETSVPPRVLSSTYSSIRSRGKSPVQRPSPESTDQLESKRQTTSPSLRVPSIRSSNEATESTPPPKKEKSRVGALVNIFQAHGLMPEKPRGGPLQMAQGSPSFDRRASYNFKGHSGNTTPTGAGRSPSGTLSKSSPPNLFPRSSISTLHTPGSRPVSRLSDIDTEASYRFGEIMKKMEKLDVENSLESVSWDAEMYG